MRQKLFFFVALCEINRIIMFFKIVEDMEVRKLCVFL